MTYNDWGDLVAQDGFTALHLSAHSGQLECLSALLVAGADTEALTAVRTRTHSPPISADNVR